jgi:hypothetical protein
VDRRLPCIGCAKRVSRKKKDTLADKDTSFHSGFETGPAAALLPAAGIQEQSILESACVNSLRPGSYGTEQLGSRLDIQDRLVYTTPQTVDSGFAVVTTAGTPRNLIRKGYTGSLTCPNLGCTYEGTFRGQWELRRHVDVAHTPKRPFLCPIVECKKHGRTPAFARPDKLTAHIQAVHHGKGAKALCPAPTCAQRPLELDLLGFHIKLQHLQVRQHGVLGKMFCAITNAARVSHQRCLLQSCTKRVKLDDFPSHLLSHTGEDLDSAMLELARAGYVVGKFHCEHAEADGGLTGGLCICGMSSIEIACPVCASFRWDKHGLEIHIEESHVRAGEDMTPFRQNILALIGSEATQVLGKDVWRDVACRLV